MMMKAIFAAAVVLLMVSCPFASASDGSHAPLMSVVESVAELRQRFQLSEVSCGECELISSIAAGAAHNASVAAGLLETVDDICTSKFTGLKATLCQDAAKVLIDLLPFIFKETESVAWPDDSGICSLLGACMQPVEKGPPEQVHLSLTASPTEMMVSWVARNGSSPTVQWGTNASSLTNVAAGLTSLASTYTFGGWQGSIFGAVMTGLPAGTQHFYRVGSATMGWSPVFSFKTLPSNIGSEERPLRVIQLADAGYGNHSDGTIAAMLAEVEAGTVDLVIHNGDAGYADAYAPHDDMWSRKIAPIASRVPYMTAPGNHELWDDFRSYRRRWGQFMPTPPAYGTPQTMMFYQLALPTVSIIMLNTETQYDTAAIDPAQLDWLSKTLPSARPSGGWSIVAGHRPLYCSNTEASQCVKFAQVLQGAVEDLFIQNNVDLVISGHMHNMELSYPMSHGQATSNNYTSPTAPVYLLNGAGGNREARGHIDAPQSWSAWSDTAHYGYSRLSITPSKLGVSFVAGTDGSVLHSITLSK